MRKPLHFLTSIVVATASIASMGLGAGAFAAGTGHEARHGGIHLESKVMDMEIVAKADLIQLYVSDHGKPLKIDGAKAKMTLLNGAEKSEIDLQPAGDKFEAKGAFKVSKGTKGIVLVTLAGKPSTTARFTMP